jgi:hypothetical protein
LLCARPSLAVDLPLRTAHLERRQPRSEKVRNRFGAQIQQMMFFQLSDKIPDGKRRDDYRFAGTQVRPRDALELLKLVPICAGTDGGRVMRHGLAPVSRATPPRPTPDFGAELVNVCCCRLPPEAVV